MKATLTFPVSVSVRMKRSRTFRPFTLAALFPVEIREVDGRDAPVALRWVAPQGGLDVFDYRAFDGRLFLPVVVEKDTQDLAMDVDRSGITHIDQDRTYHPPARSLSLDAYADALADGRSVIPLTRTMADGTEAAPSLPDGVAETDLSNVGSFGAQLRAVLNETIAVDGVVYRATVLPHLEVGRYSASVRTSGFFDPAIFDPRRFEEALVHWRQVADPRHFAGDMESFAPEVTRPDLLPADRTEQERVRAIAGSIVQGALRPGDRSSRRLDFASQSSDAMIAFAVLREALAEGDDDATRSALLAFLATDFTVGCYDDIGRIEAGMNLLGLLAEPELAL